MNEADSKPLVPAPVAAPKPAAPPPSPATSKAAPMFQKAEKRQGHLRGAITGPSGSGKTYSALLIARGVADEIRRLEKREAKVGVIDTENFSAADYADKFDIVTVAIAPPYTVAKYLAAYKAAEIEGIDVLIIDSISHAWAGEGGLLDKKSALDSRNGSNQFTNWAPISREHEQFKSALLNNRMHLICTMRSKQDYILQEDGRGKSVPKKVGLAPVQREGMEYEFQFVFDMAMDHSATGSKDRTGLYADGTPFTPAEKTGHELYAWRMAGAAETYLNVVPEQGRDAGTQTGGNGAAGPAGRTAEQMQEIGELVRQRGTTLQAVKLTLGLGAKILDFETAQLIINALQKMPAVSA